MLNREIVHHPYSRDGLEPFPQKMNSLNQAEGSLDLLDCHSKAASRRNSTKRPSRDFILLRLDQNARISMISVMRIGKKVKQK